ncbi:MAG: response regulator [Sphingomonas sp.]
MAADPLGAIADPIREVPSVQPSLAKYVYIVDDDSMVRRSLSFALTTAGFEVRAFACGQDFLDEVTVLRPGCVLLDVRMPQTDGIQVLDALASQVDQFDVLIMTAHGDVDTAVKAMKRGARDFLEKPFTDQLLLDVLNGLFLALPTRVEAHEERSDAVLRVSRLTSREREVLDGLVAGLPNKLIAYRLGISIRTVEMHRGRLMERLGVKSLVDALKIAVLASMPNP